jgi:hypothetical protein
MQVAQRGTSATSVSVSSYNVTDRWRFGNTTAGVYTISQSSESPDGFGFSQKLDCTTADASLAAGDSLLIQQRFEGVDLQSIAKGTSSAKQFTVSFYVKTNKTGTYQVNFYDLDNTRLVSGTYAVANTNWNRYTVTFAADTTGAFTNDTNLSAQLEFWLAAGSNYTTGSTSTSWGAASNVNRASSLNVNLSDNTSNEFHITGVQLELGSVATDFEHRSYGEELALCQRYFWKWSGGATYAVLGNAWVSSANTLWVTVPFPVTLRTGSPTISLGGSFQNRTNSSAITAWSASGDGLSPNSVTFNFTSSGLSGGEATAVRATNDTSAYISADAEL